MPKRKNSRIIQDGGLYSKIFTKTKKTKGSLTQINYRCHKYTD